MLTDKIIKAVHEDIPKINSQLEQKAKQVDLIVERKRIDNIISISSGEVDNVEVSDARIGIDGRVYNNIGDAIRNQVEKVDNNFIESINLFNKEKVELKKYIKTDGSIESYDTLFITHKIYVKPNDKFIMRRNTASDNACGGFYTDEDVFVTNVKGVPLSTNTNLHTITVPDNNNISYMKVNNLIANLDTLMIVRGSEYPSEYIEYYKLLEESFLLNSKQKEEVENIVSPQINILETKIESMKINNEFSRFDFALAKTFKNQLNANVNKTPVFSLIDDDITSLFKTNLKPLLDARGFKCSLACITNNVGTSGNLTLDELKTYQENGFEIVSHSKTSDRTIWRPYDSNSEVTTGNFINIENELKESQQWLKDNGFKGYETFVYPWGQYNNNLLRIKELTRKYYKNAINSTGGNNNLPYDNMYINRHQLNSNNDIQITKNLIDDTIANGKWLILLTHSGGSEYNSQYTANVLDYILSKGYSIGTFSEGLKVKGNIIQEGEFTNENSIFIGAI